MSKSSKLMTPVAASRIQSTTAKANGGSVPKDSFAARATSAAQQNVNQGKVSVKGK